MMILEKLLELNVPLEEINKATKRGRTPLRQTASRGHTRVAEKLLSLGMTAEMVNAVDALKGRSALHYAAFHANIDLLNLLLQKGADPQIQDKKGKTALNLCTEQWTLRGEPAYEDVAEILINVDAVAAREDSYLVSAAAANGSQRILKILHGIGADLGKPDAYGWTPLLLAKRYSHRNTVEYLDRQMSFTGVKPTIFESSSKSLTISDDGKKMEFAAGGA